MYDISEWVIVIKFFIRQCVKMITQNLILPALYFIYSRKPVQTGKTVFVDAHHDVCPPSMELLVQEWKNRGYEIKELYVDYQKNSYLKVLKSMMAFMKEYATSSYVVICDNFLPVTAGRKRKETKVIQLWHGSGAFKKFGYDCKDDIPPYYKGKVYHNYDAVIVSSEACRKPFSSAMALPVESMIPLGSSRTDIYYDKEYIECKRKKLQQIYPESKGKKIILYAPTFRGNAANPYLVGLEQVEQLQQQLTADWYVIIKKHPHMEQEENNDKIMHTEEILPFADILISDYSSIIFDYCIFDRPMIFFAPDLEKYKIERGFYLDYENLPGPIVVDSRSLQEAVKQTEQDAYQQTRRQFFEKYMETCDGNVTRRIADYMEQLQYSEQ